MSWDVSEGPQSSDSFPRFLIDPSILWAKCKHLVGIKGKYIIYALLPYGAVKKAFSFRSEGLSFSLISCYLSNFFFKLIYLFLAALGFRCCTQAFSSCGEWGLLFDAVCGLLIVLASLCCRARALGTRASVVVACGLSSCSSQALEHRLSSCGARA